MFVINSTQNKKINEWMSTHKNAYEGAIGGRYTFCFTPTSLGEVIVVKDSVTNTEIDVSEYEDW